jgi:photosystem II stability/assembly factor-like uncharacterized protein
MPLPRTLLAGSLTTLLALGVGVAVASADPHVPAPRVRDVVVPDSTLLRQYRWRSIGPDRGGRSIAASGVRGRPNEAYFGATGGGLWKTVDAGANWFPVTDGQITSASVGAVAVAETNPDLVFIGTGEQAIRGNIMPGDGVYRSRDAGKTWQHVGFRNVDAISKIRIHPTNPDIVYVAAFGKYSVPSTERGVFKSTDGGTTWRRVLYRNDVSGAVTIAIDRANPNVIYAALWEAFRKEYTMSSGGPGSGIFKSTDGGETWREITRNPGLPKGLIGKVGLATSAADPNRVYALVENENGGLFRSDDGGATWAFVNGDRNIRQRAFYYTHLHADPANADRVYIQNVSFFRSDDGGKTLTSIGQGTHGDFHDLWINPDDPKHLVIGNDGGGTVTKTGGAPYTPQTFPTSQWYHAITTKHQPFHVCGSQQDNSTLCIPMDWNRGQWTAARGATHDSSGRYIEHAAGGMAVSYQVGGGEPGYIAPDPLDVDIFYAGTNNGRYLDKYNRRTGLSREVNPYPWFYSGEPALEIKERWQWTFPIIFSKADPRLLFTSSQRLWATRDGGKTWDNLSPDLTRADPKTLGRSGGPITGDMNGPEVYATIFAVGPGKKNANVIWTGSDDGLVHVTRDFGKTWTNVTPRDMPEFGRVSQIDASSFDDGTAYISVRRPLLDDRAPHIWKTSDFGATWTKIVNGIRADAYVHAVREDPTRRGLLYAGTQHGVWISYDDGANWSDLSLNLPDVPVADLIVEDNELVIGTHGRSFWVLDDITPLRQWTSAIASAPAHLYTPVPALRSTSGATVTYTFATAPQRARLEVIDSTGTVLRAFTHDTLPPGAARGGGGRRGGGPVFIPKAAGINRFTWDLRTEPIVGFPGMILWGAGLNGPVVPPGTYTLRLTVDGRTVSAPLVVQRNPLVPEYTDADLHAQYQFTRRVRDKATEANLAVIAIRNVKAQVERRLAAKNDGGLRTAGRKLLADASAIEEKIYQVRNQSGQDPLNFPIKVNNRLANLLSMAERGDGPPGTYMPEIFEILSTELKGYTDALDTLWKNDLAAFNQRLGRLGLAPVEPSCAKAEGCGPTA